MQIIHKPPDRVRGTMSTSPAAYDADFFRWTEEQRQHLLNRNYAQLDWDNLAEEVLSMGKSEIKALESRMAVLLAYLLKWAWQPDMRCRSWEATIEEQRSKIARLFRQMPSLKTKIGDESLEFWPDVWETARYRAEEETRIAFRLFPAEVPWSLDEILADGWFPEPVNR